MEQISRRQQQQRSNSISGQDFHLNGGYQRLKYSVCQPTNIFHDDSMASHQQSFNRNQQIPSPLQQLTQQRTQIGRSPSPISVGGAHFANQQDGTLKFSHQTRNQLHASLECLSGPYTEYQQQKVQQLHLLQQQQHQLHQQQQYQQQLQQQQQHQYQSNPHYAASYVLAPAPANAVFNQNGDQDLAAAVISGPSQYHSAGHTLNGLSNSANLNAANQYQTQSLINRALAQVTHSPFRRMTSSNITTTTSSQNPLGQASNATHSIRAGHSSMSLASSSYILEDKFENDIRKLQSELKSEKEKNEALNSQLSINSSLMAAFEQSLTTLNARLRQLATLNEKKDNEIAELRQQLSTSESNLQDQSGQDTLDKSDEANSISDRDTPKLLDTNNDKDNDSERNLMKTIEDLKRQLIEKDRLLTDTRLEALSAAHQLEQLESKLNGEHSLLLTEEDLDEGVVNHSPSESDATTDSIHFSEISSQIVKSKHSPNREATSIAAEGH